MSFISKMIGELIRCCGKNNKLYAAIGSETTSSDHQAERKHESESSLECFGDIDDFP